MFSRINQIRNRAGDDQGFTLIELLVVILIIGILAAIALPTFLGQSDKAKDSSAKSDVRNAVTQLQSCLVDDTIDNCKMDKNVVQNGVTVGPAGATADNYKLTKVSKSSDATDFNISKVSTTSNRPGSYTYTCGDSVAGGKGNGGCPTDGVWSPK